MNYNICDHERYDELCKAEIIKFTDKSMDLVKAIDEEQDVEKNLFNLIDSITLAKPKDVNNTCSITSFICFLMNLYREKSKKDLNRDLTNEKHRIIHEDSVGTYTILSDYLFNHLVNDLHYHSRDYSTIKSRQKAERISLLEEGCEEYLKLEQDIIKDLKGFEWEIISAFIVQYDKADPYYGIKIGSFCFVPNTNDEGSDGEGTSNNKINWYKFFQFKQRSSEIIDDKLKLDYNKIRLDIQVATENIQHRLNTCDAINYDFVIITNIDEDQIITQYTKDKFKWDSNTLSFKDITWRNKHIIGKKYFNNRKLFEGDLWNELYKTIN